MTMVFKGEPTDLSFVLRPVERRFYTLSVLRNAEEWKWPAHGLAILAFRVTWFVALYALMRLQGFLPLNLQALG